MQRSHSTHELSDGHIFKCWDSAMAVKQKGLHFKETPWISIHLFSAFWTVASGGSMRKITINALCSKKRFHFKEWLVSHSGLDSGTAQETSFHPHTHAWNLWLNLKPWALWRHPADCLVHCDPLCEIQTKVSKSNYEITSIKVWFLPFISL